jgi:hypothetical protein
MVWVQKNWDEEYFKEAETLICNLARISLLVI